MKALVTGGTGFIGRQVVDLLVENDHSVRLFSRKEELPGSIAGKGASLFRGDLKDPGTLLDAMEGMEVFYHIGELRNTSRRAAESNVELVKRVAGHLGRAGIRRIVFISSLTVAGIPASTPATEETPQRTVPGDRYTSYKKRCEQLLSEGAGGVEYVVIRPGVVYGPGSRHLGNLVRTVKRLGPLGFPWIGRGRAVAPFIHVKDLARAIYLAGIEPAASGQVINLTDGADNTWSDFFHAIAGALGVSLRVFPVPPLFLSAPALFFDIAGLLWGSRLDLNTYVRYVTTDLLFDNGKAQRLLRWKPEYTLLRGVEEMVREYGM
jgi:nucleoside-diphosphate-sugar epimerase